ncbi:MAG: nucleotidyltransferase domain-containing protein [Candidatus Odinarchaeota archaeon]|nr:nucleotidyltransferase domain-containing protein [Candidatus Odinarchaeota archaeon]
MENEEYSRKQVISKLKEILEPDENILFAYLFGSLARGQTHTYSDIDVAVYVKTLTPDEYLRIFKKLSRSFEKDIDLIMLNDAPPLLRHKVIYEGVLIFCKDSKLHYKFVSSTLIEALDFKETYKIIIDGYRKYSYVG